VNLRSGDAPLPVPGFTAAGLACGIKKHGGPDLMLIASETPAAFTGVFTRNVVQAAPVTLTRQVAAAGACRAVVANSGNANACTGPQGLEDARATQRLVGGALGVPAEQVAVCSTGVIGEPLPMDRLAPGIPLAAGALSADGWEDAAEAIRTTDTRAKCHAGTVEADGRVLTVTGIAKGSGMIHPDMATMLAFLATDAPVAPGDLKTLLARTVEATFNRITVDGDTSTNDCVLLLAGGRAGGPALAPDRPGWDGFAALVRRVCDALATAIVADGEGATKVVTVSVRGLPTDAEALKVARQVATSSLVKTALFGADPNWGRLLSAAGQAGVPFDPEAASVTIGIAPLVRDGAHLGPEAEAAAAKVMATTAYPILLELGNGPGTASVRTCDLSYDYVRINADYRS
jgi:glutamate N-acetyltransferase/amino-acid N-acetyltransferase